MNVWYMNGAGNDFMVIDARGKEYDFRKLALELCKLSGADGFMAVDHSNKADFKLHFYNADGSRGEMCGNGARCICRYAFDNGIAGENMVVETDAGLVYGRRLSRDQYRVQLNNPGVFDLHRKADCAYVELGNPGVPHAVKEVPGLTFENKADFWELGKSLRHDPAFPKGANANMYAWTGENAIRVLTFERGVEDYTLACGTGCGSTAAALWTAGKLPGGRLIAHNRGGTLTVTIQDQDGCIHSIFLEGPTEIVRIYEI